MESIHIQLSEQDVDNARGMLLRAAQHLLTKMESLIERIEKDGVAVRVNDLGEVQESGPNVDRLCAVPHERRYAIARLRTVQS